MMKNQKKEGSFYVAKVRLFLNEYGGIDLEEFCKAERVSYSKMCHCLVYIFLSRDFTRLRVYYFHHKGEILTEKILYNNRYVTPVFEDTEKNVYRIAWKDFVYLLKNKFCVTY